jgi:hypothetical protein
MTIFLILEVKHLATIGQQLNTPESGWQRIDNTNTKIAFYGLTNTTTTDSYNGSIHSTSSASNAKIQFRFYGTRLRIISPSSTTYSQTPNNITIDGVTETYSLYSASGSYQQVLVYQKDSLSNGVHTVTIVPPSGVQFGFDAIDIDSTGYLVHPYLVNKSSLLSVQNIGESLPCRYKSATSGALGIFTEMGTTTATEIPVLSSATPDGSFNWVYVGYDYLGRKKYIADRNIQHTITWNTINTAGFASGLGKEIIDWKYTQDLCNGGTAFASSNRGGIFVPASAFDNSYVASNSWVSVEVGYAVIGAYVGYEFTSPKHIRKITYY